MNRSPWWHHKYIQFSLVVAITLSAGLYRDGIPALFPFMRAEFGASRAVLGMYVSLLYLVSAALAVFSGYVADRLGAKRALLWGVATLGSLVVLHTLAGTFSVLLVLAVLSGVGFSIIGPGSNKVVAEQFAANNRGTPMGLIFVGWSAGGLLGAMLLPTLGALFGWRVAAVAVGITMLAVIGVFKVTYRDDVRPGAGSRASGDSNETPGELPSFREGFSALIGDRDVLLVCMVGLVLGSISGTMAAHYTLFLHLDYGYSEAVAGLGFAFLHAGSIAGRPAWGIINDRLLGGSERLGFLFIHLSTVAVLLGLVGVSRFVAAPSTALLFGLTFLAGFCGRGWPGVLFAAVAKRVDLRSAGMAMGFALLFIRLGITVAPPLLGYVADLTGGYEMSWLLTAALALVSGLIFYRLGAEEEERTETRGR